MLKDEKHLQNEFRNDNFETVVVSTWDGTLCAYYVYGVSCDTILVFKTNEHFGKKFLQ